MKRLGASPCDQRWDSTAPVAAMSGPGREVEAVSTLFPCRGVVPQWHVKVRHHRVLGK